MNTTINRLLIFFSLVFSTWPAVSAISHTPETQQLFSRLDSAIDNSAEWNAIKRHRIAELSKKTNLVRTDEERYWLNKNLFDEYVIFNADSAMMYADRNMAIAMNHNDISRKMEWTINKSFILTAIGLLKEAQDLSETIESNNLPPELLSSYYDQLAYLYSHFGQYAGTNSASSTEYYVQSYAYRDSSFSYASNADPLYLWYKGWMAYNNNEDTRDETIKQLKADVDSAKMDTRHDAMKAYVLARLYNKIGDQENHLKYLIISALCDVKIANKDIASLEELGKMMLNEGNIERAYLYINHCQEQAQDFHNRVRALSLSNIDKIIHDEYNRRNDSQSRRVSIYMIILSLLAVFLVATIVLLLRKNNKLNESHSRLSELNAELKDNIRQLTELREAQDTINSKLKDMNLKFSNVNRQLRESNRIKEEYVGQMFSICSEYINKLESLRKEVSRKLKVGQIDSLQMNIDSPSMVQNELKDFYRVFDTIFLNLFPDFVKDFNKLLRPDEQIVLNEGELLNTPLRIHALIRLGITDSVKIAALLHYSSQTVYNNRLRIRNKACISKAEFSEAVRTIGKFEI